MRFANKEFSLAKGIVLGGNTDLAQEDLDTLSQFSLEGREGAIRDHSVAFHPPVLVDKYRGRRSKEERGSG